MKHDHLSSWPGGVVCLAQTAMAGHDELRMTRTFSSLLKSLPIALPAALLSFLASSEPAYADLKLCNRMSYVIEAAIGIDHKSTTATRGWFRIDPAACRLVVQGALAADRILLSARALGVYGSSPIPQNGTDTLCVAPENFVIAAARQCRSGQTPAPFTQITPSQAEDGDCTASIMVVKKFGDCTKSDVSPRLFKNAARAAWVLGPSTPSMAPASKPAIASKR